MAKIVILFDKIRSAVHLAGWAAALLLLVGITSARAGEPIRVSDYRIAGDAVKTRIVMQLDREPDMRWFLLRAPHRLVIDLPEARFAFDAAATAGKGLVKHVRYGDVEDGRARIILAADGPFRIVDLDVIENEGPAEGFRLVADLEAGSEADFDRALLDQSTTTATTTTARRGDRLGAPAETQERRFTVAIDPGHGGIDGGAESPGGTVEKAVTLSFALELKRHLEADPRLHVVMTREKDDFLRLDERVRIARQHAADLFISIHADTIRLAGVRGATVYTLSDRASDAEAAALAARENLADQLAGVVVEAQQEEVADVLADLMRRETHSFSIRFARSLIGEMTDKVALINNPLRSAGFRVLRAPDIPSVLIELGYLSNPKDEAQLLDPEWRGKAVGSIAAAVSGFAAARSAFGG